MLDFAKPKRKKRLFGPEETLQCAVVKYLRYTLPSHWLVHHSANEEYNRLDKIKGGAMGKVAGWPDIEIVGEKDVGFATPQLVPALWFIELKAGKGTTTPAQDAVHARLRRFGIPVGIARSLDEVRDLVVEWNLPSSDLALRQIKSPLAGTRGL